MTEFDFYIVVVLLVLSGVICFLDMFKEYLEERFIMAFISFGGGVGVMLLAYDLLMFTRNYYQE